MKTKQFVTLFFTCLLGVLPVAVSALPFVTSADGSEVTDQKTGLIWRHCSEGMSWNGSTCTGIPVTFTHEAALQRAAAQAASTGVAWRLPNVKELTSISDKNYAEPTIDSAVFPSTPSGDFWSSTPYAAYDNWAWYVSFMVGNVDGFHSRNQGSYVRLVRSGQ